jgi:hypothetical protein
VADVGGPGKFAAIFYEDVTVRVYTVVDGISKFALKEKYAVKDQFGNSIDLVCLRE